jgi:OOP family OmpA-OmpF porin
MKATQRSSGLGKGLVLALAVTVGATACATGGQSSRGGWGSPAGCATIGALLGAGGGAAAANARHSEDSTQDYAVGAGVGAVAGGVLGWVLCSLGAEPVRQSPKANATGQPLSGTAPLDVRFQGSATDADGRIVSYAWDLGDGTRTGDRNVRHLYTEPGTYTARLVATDNDGLTGSDSVRVNVAAPRAARPPEPEPPRVERRIVLRGVQFNFDSDQIRPGAVVILDEAARVLKENPDVRVEVAGHTDSIGSNAYNQGLSERRAGSVRRYLVSRGVEASRLRSQGYGESQPVADNAFEEGRDQNRRVELNQTR